MDLKSDFPFWPLKNGLLATYPPLTDDVHCDVIVVGGGITGALVTHELTQRGLGVVTLDKREIGQGSTSATTALLQYEIDVPLCDLIEKVGKAYAERAYHLCLDAIPELEELASQVEFSTGFARKISLYAASRKRDVRDLKREFEVRTACGLPVEFLEGAEVTDRFSLSAPALLVSPVAADCDAFALTHGLFQKCLQQGARVFDRTAVSQIQNTSDGVRVTTDRGPVVTANSIVFATGYESQQDLRQKIVQLKSTYALVTQPLPDLGSWSNDWIFWESARPYLYLRTTGDCRILAGGEDDVFRNPARRDASIPRKSERILRRLHQLFPGLPLEIEYAWAGTFGETKDGLPYIGSSPEQPQAHYALGFGGNGIVFSMIASKILADQLTGKHNRDAEIFRFDR